MPVRRQLPKHKIMRTLRTRPGRIARLAVGAGIAVVAAGNAVVLAGAAVVCTLHMTALPVLTASMRPAYAPGDAVLTRQVAVASLRPGMIVSVVPPGETRAFAHRIVSVSADRQHPTITTKGDANPAADAWRTTLQTATVPQVVGAVPRLGAVPVALSTPRGHDLSLSLLGLLLTLGGASQIVVLSRRPHGTAVPTTPHPLTAR